MGLTVVDAGPIIAVLDGADAHHAAAVIALKVRLPLPPSPPPSHEYLEWHGDTIFRG